MASRCSVSTDPRYRGVCIRIDEMNGPRKNKVTNSASVVYTPEFARQVAREILIEADKIDALGGSTEVLKTMCAPGKQQSDQGS